MTERRLKLKKVRAAETTYADRAAEERRGGAYEIHWDGHLVGTVEDASYHGYMTPAEWALYDTDGRPVIRWLPTRREALEIAERRLTEYGMLRIPKP